VQQVVAKAGLERLARRVNMGLAQDQRGVGAGEE